MGPARIFDLHCDTIDLLAMRDFEPYASQGCRLGDPGFTDLARNRCAIDLERMADFSWAQCFAIWVPDDYRDAAAWDFYVRARDWFLAQCDLHDDLVCRARNMGSVDAALASGRTAAMLTIENGSPIGTDLGRIGQLAADGVKMVTLTWNGANPIGSGNLTQGGLTPFGAKAVRALEDAHIVVDVSHLNDAGFADLLGIARRPFVASHSNARAVCDHPRNLTDDQFRAIRDAGGLVGLNFYRSFITSRDIRAHATIGAGNGLSPAAAVPGTAGGIDPALDVTPDELFAHVEHFLDLGGDDVLALGSDWDGSDVPVWLASCSCAGQLRHLFAQRFGDDLAEKVFFTNARDFFARIEA